MIKHYRKPVRKQYNPDWYDYSRNPWPGLQPGAVVLVDSSWGPFRGFTYRHATTGEPMHGTCGVGSFRPVTPFGSKANRVPVRETCVDCGTINPVFLTRCHATGDVHNRRAV